MSMSHAYTPSAKMSTLRATPANCCMASLLQILDTENANRAARNRHLPMAD